jgi:hypothetical protein
MKYATCTHSRERYSPSVSYDMICYGMIFIDLIFTKNSEEASFLQFLAVNLLRTYKAYGNDMTRTVHLINSSVELALIS